jgi:hypothetical protein
MKRDNWKIQRIEGSNNSFYENNWDFLVGMIFPIIGILILIASLFS